MTIEGLNCLDDRLYRKSIKVLYSSSNDMNSRNYTYLYGTLKITSYEV